MTDANDSSTTSVRPKSKLHDQLARWIDERRDSNNIPVAADGWPDVEAWRDAAQRDGFDCNSEDVRRAIRVCLLFRRIRAAKAQEDPT